MVGDKGRTVKHFASDFVISTYDMACMESDISSWKSLENGKAIAVTYWPTKGKVSKQNVKANFSSSKQTRVNIAYKSKRSWFVN